jgi:signal transduction histidine kinase
MCKKLSIKKQFIFCFIIILLLSFIFSIVSLMFLGVLMNTGVIHPADYYANKLPKVVEYINSEGTKVLDKNNKKEMEKHIPLEGISYVVLNGNLKEIYGTIKNVPKSDIKNIMGGEKSGSDGTMISAKITRYVPIGNQVNYKNGVVILKYYIKMSTKDPRYNFLVNDNYLIIFPFIFIIIFTYIVAKRFSKNINKPINDLICAAEKVKMRELDFTIQSDYKNEIGELVNAFDDMKEELKVSLKQQWEAEQERKNMISSIAHDLRTPLTIIKGHTEVLMEDGIDNTEKVFKYLKTIDANTDRVIKLINDMNTLTKVEAGGFSINTEAVDADDFIRRIEADYKILCGKKDIAFKFYADDKRKTNAIVNIDPDRLLQVIDNIMSNSIRFTPERGNIDLTAVITEEKISFEIKNDGPSFSNEDIKNQNIFKKFYQSDKSRSQEKLHFGLGLYISKCIIEKHGGKIEAWNDEEGSPCILFYIMLGNCKSLG